MLGMLGVKSSAAAPVKPNIVTPPPEPIVIEGANTSPERVLPALHQGRLRAVVSTNSISEENPEPYVVTAGEDRDICIANGSTGELIRRISGFTGRPGHPGHTDKIYCLALWFNPPLQQHHIYSAGEDKMIRVWNLETGKHIQTFAQAHTEFIHSLRVCEATRQIISASYDKSIVLWSLKTGEQMDVIRQDKVLFGCDVNAEAKAVACGNGTHINVWDLASGRRNNTLRIHKRTVVSIAYPKPELLISGSDDKTLCFWNPCDQSAPLLRRVEIGVPVYTLKVYDDGTAFFLIAGGFAAPHNIYIYNLANAHELLLTLSGHSSKVVNVELWSDAEGMPKLVSVAWDNRTLTWDLLAVVQTIHENALTAKNKTGKFAGGEGGGGGVQY